jgi:SAM-dependent methyltransferase
MSSSFEPCFDWRGRYEEDHTPWDLGGTHPGLAQWMSLNPANGRSAMVPGCGRGHDALALALAGWRVDALDIVDLAGETLRGEFVQRDGRFLVTNVLDFDPEGERGRGRFDLVFEHTIFCAISPEQRAVFGVNMARCLKPGGLLLSLLFPTNKPAAEGGPPFRATPDELSAALGDDFELLGDEPHKPTSGGRKWAERSVLYRRK